MVAVHGVLVVEGDEVPVVVDTVGQQEDLGPGVMVDICRLGDHHGGLSAAAPPGVGVDVIVLDSDVVTLVHPDPTVRAVVHLVVVDPDVVPGPGHNSSANKLVGLDQPVFHGLTVGDVVVWSNYLQ